MPEIKGTVTEDLVKQALYSGEVNKLLAGPAGRRQ